MKRLTNDELERLKALHEGYKEQLDLLDQEMRRRMSNMEKMRIEIWKIINEPSFVQEAKK